MFLKVIACEIAFREFCYATARSKNVIDLEFVTQGHHNTPCTGHSDIQRRIDAVPANKYDAIVLGYGLCSSIISGLITPHTPLVIPRAHDCITFFLGSKERYRAMFDAHPGTYYYTSGWLECRRRRPSGEAQGWDMFTPAHADCGMNAVYERWVAKYGEERARYLREAMGEWTAQYSRGVLIDFDFTKSLELREEVQQICTARGWEYAEVEGDLGLLQRLLDGEWRDKEVLMVQPQQTVAASFNDNIIDVQRPSPGLTKPH